MGRSIADGLPDGGLARGLGPLDLVAGHVVEAARPELAHVQVVVRVEVVDLDEADVVHGRHFDLGPFVRGLVELDVAGQAHLARGCGCGGYRFDLLA